MFSEPEFAYDGTMPSFAAALRAAIDARGLGLVRIQDRLSRRGVSVSLATLSYWQTGRSRPVRQSSLAVVRHLEDILDVPRGALTALIDPHRPSMGAFWPQDTPVEDVIREVDVGWDDRLTRLSQHDRVVVGGDRGERTSTSRQVLRAEADGPDRWIVISHIDEHDRALPTIRPLRNCHLGRTIGRPESGLLVAELVFDAPLRRGETIVLEHELVSRPPHPLATNYERKFRLPVREYVLEVCFDPAAAPGRCEQFARTAGNAERVRAMSVDDRNTVHSVALDFGPGCFGFRWDWD